MKDYSQNGEQAVILETFEALGIKEGHLVDLGAGDGRTMSNTRALLDRGWTGDLYDGDPKGAKDVKQAWITRDWLRNWMENDAPHYDFLNLDLDGNDYWFLWDILHANHDPSLIVCEINPIFQRYEDAVMPYDPGHVWNNDTWYGASLAAFKRISGQYGYTLMYLHAGINAFLLRNDHAKAHPELIRPIDYRVKRDHKPHDPSKQWLRL